MPSSSSDHAAIAAEYTRAVVSGRIPACKWVQLACQRQIDDLARAARGWEYRFDQSKANRACQFIELLPHVKGTWAGKRQNLKLEPWQCFIEAAIFGWVRNRDGKRRFRTAYICVPRKNGKSAIAAGTGLYMFCADGEFGSEIYSGATSEKQAWEVFRPARLMVERTPRLKDKFGIYVGAKTMAVLSNGSRFEPVIGKPGDGASPSCGIVDEYHEHDSDDLFDTLKTGMLAREQPLMLVITTAGTNLGGPCYSLQQDVQKVLGGAVKREELFGIVYTIDDSDPWESPESLRKANPNFGVSIFAEDLEIEQRNAVQSASKQNVFKTKHLNVWCGASTAWMNMISWRALGDSSLREDDFAGEVCCAGLDLSSKKDISARVKIFRKKINDADHYYCFPTFYLPESITSDPAKQQYQDWVANSHLKATPGNVIDYKMIGDDTIADCERFRIAELAYDDWNAEELTQRVAENCSTQRVVVPNQVRGLSEPMKNLEALVIDGRFHHNDNPAMNWMMANVVAHVDAKDNIFPRKDRYENKIDGPVAAVMALSRAFVQPEVMADALIEIW